MDILLQGIWYAAESFYATKSYLETLSGKMSTLKQEARDKFLDVNNGEYDLNREEARKIAEQVISLVKDVSGPTAVILEYLLEEFTDLVSSNADNVIAAASDSLAKEQFSHGSKEDARARLKEAKETYSVMADAYSRLPGENKVTIPELPKTGGGRPVGSKNTGLTVGEYYFTLNGEKSAITTPSQFIYQATKESGGSNKNGSLSMAEFISLLKANGIDDWTQNDWTVQVNDKVTLGYVRSV